MRADMRPAFFLLLGLLSSSAAGETFKGMLIPEEYGRPTPIVVELEKSEHSLSGKITTSFPYLGGGPIFRSRRAGDICDLKSVINSEVSIALHGNCTSSTFNGNYTMFFRDQTER